MLADARYRDRWERKANAYRASGIWPLDEGGGPSGTLITSRDLPNGGIDANEIARLADLIAK